MDFRILGPLEIADEGRPILIGPPKERALLVLLLLHANEVVARDRLIDELWAEEPPESAVAVLQTYVSHLRKVLSSQRIVTRAPGYLVEIAPDELDLPRFEGLVAEGEAALERGEPAKAAELLGAALSLWRGPPLADFAYEPFAQPAMRRLEELRLGALERKIDAEIALGGRSGTVAELEDLVRLHPFRERFRGQLMLALYRAGRQADALEAYADTRRTFVDELGLEPGHGLQELHGAILRQDAGLDTARSDVEPGPVEPGSRSILVVPTADPATVGLLTLAEPLARAQQRELIVVRLLSEPTSPAQTTGQLARLREEIEARGVRARVAAYTSLSAADDVVRLLADQDVDLVLLDAPAGLLQDGPPHAAVAEILRAAACDVGLLVGEGTLSPATGPIVVPFGGAEHDWGAVELAAWAARAFDTSLRLVGTAGRPLRGRRDASRLLGRASLVLQAAVGIVCEPALVRGGPAGIIEAAADASLLVLGLSARWSTEGLGSARIEIARTAGAPTVLVRKGLRPGGLAPKESLTRFTWTLDPGSAKTS